MEGTPGKQLDLVFVVDCTGSMGAWIEAAKSTIVSILESIGREGVRARFGLVSYRDHPPQDESYAVQRHEFTSDVKVALANVRTMEADGGGDGPESLTCALEQLLHMGFNKQATRVAVVVTDAPPHGIGEPGDGFAGGCACGFDIMKTARKLKDEQGIVVHVAGCEDGFSVGTRAFMRGLAFMTGGQYAALRDAGQLGAMILGSSKEEVDLTTNERLIDEQCLAVYREMLAEGKRWVDCEMVFQEVTRRLQAKGVRVWAYHGRVNPPSATDGIHDKIVGACEDEPHLRSELNAIRAGMYGGGGAVGGVGGFGGGRGRGRGGGRGRGRGRGAAHRPPRESGPKRVDLGFLTYDMSDLDCRSVVKTLSSWRGEDDLCAASYPESVTPTSYEEDMKKVAETRRHEEEAARARRIAAAEKAEAAEAAAAAKEEEKRTRVLLGADDADDDALDGDENNNNNSKTETNLTNGIRSEPISLAQVRRVMYRMKNSQFLRVFARE